MRQARLAGRRRFPDDRFRHHERQLWHLRQPLLRADLVEAFDAGHEIVRYQVGRIGQRLLDPVGVLHAYQLAYGIDEDQARLLPLGGQANLLRERVDEQRDVRIDVLREGTFDDEDVQIGLLPGIEQDPARQRRGVRASRLGRQVVRGCIGVRRLVGLRELDLRREVGSKLPHLVQCLEFGIDSRHREDDRRLRLDRRDVIAQKLAETPDDLEAIEAAVDSEIVT